MFLQPLPNAEALGRSGPRLLLVEVEDQARVAVGDEGAREDPEAPRQPRDAAAELHAARVRELPAHARGPLVQRAAGPLLQGQGEEHRQEKLCHLHRNNNSSNSSNTNSNDTNTNNNNASSTHNTNNSSARATFTAAGEETSAMRLARTSGEKRRARRVYNIL